MMNHTRDDDETTRAVAIRMMVHGAVWTLVGVAGVIATASLGLGGPTAFAAWAAVVVGLVDLARGGLRTASVRHQPTLRPHR
jgi:hypothetical protein